MGEPRPGGGSKLDRDTHPIHCQVDTPVFKKFRRMCVDEGTTPTEKVRELISKFVESRES
jgi:hypothetical protein